MNVYEDEETGEVVIDGLRIEGFIGEESCNLCGQYLVYFDKYDALFCPACNKWIEGTCGDRDCEFCKHRPQKPLRFREGQI